MMKDTELMDVAHELVAGEQGLLAMDESTSTCNQRFAAAGIPATEEMRRAYRELIVTTPGLNGPIAGAILFEETLRQTTGDGRRFVDVLNAAGIIPGIKVDRGAKPLAGFPGEKVTEGLDGLRERLAEYRALGARFAKWRAVIQIDDGLPTPACVRANAQGLARYAALCQEAGLVPIVEPEVLMEGDHTIERCFSVTANALHAVFHELHLQRVDVRAMLLKPNMILAGRDCAEQPSDDYIADLTVIGLMNTLPAGVPGVAFLSGGQTGEQACARLHEMNVRFADRTPWALTFSFSRAIQFPALEIWGGREENVAAAQQALLHRAQCAQAASGSRYDPVLEEPETAASAGEDAGESA